MNSNICPNCGLQHTNKKTCPRCGKPVKDVLVEQEKVEQNEQIQNQTETPKEQLTIEQQVEEIKKGNKIAKISLALMFVPWLIQGICKIIFYITDILISIKLLIFPCYVLGLLMMFDGRSKYPRNKSLKVAMWLSIIPTILFIAFIVILIIVFSSLNNCSVQ